VDESIKEGLDVEFNESGSTPGLSEILDSDNDLNLSEREMKKLIKKNLAKQYDFKQDEDVKNQLRRLKQKDKAAFKEEAEEEKKEEKLTNKDLKRIDAAGESNNLLNKKKINSENTHKKSAIELNNKTKSSFFTPNSNQREKYPDSPRRKKYIGELITFDNNNNNNAQKQTLAKLKAAASAVKNNLKHLKIKINPNENLQLDKEETADIDEISFSSNHSLMEQVTKIYKMGHNSSGSLIAVSNLKDNNLINNEKEGKLKTNSSKNENIYNKRLNHEYKQNIKAILKSELKNSNFFHRFKLFENNNLKNKNNLRNFINENISKKNNNPNVKNKENSNNNYKLSHQDKIYLTAKEVKHKKLDELYVKSINYDKILKSNIDIMKTLFPNKNEKKISKDIDDFRRATHNGFFKKLNEQEFNNQSASRNTVLEHEFNKNTMTTNSANHSVYNHKNNNGEIKIKYEDEGNKETLNNLNNNTSLKIDTKKNYTIDNIDADGENKNKKKFHLLPLNKTGKNNFRKFSEYENLNKSNDRMTYSQAVCNIVKDKNEIFDDRGGINTEFLRNLRKINSNNYLGSLVNKCYDTKNFEKFDKELIEKINKISK